MRYLLGVVVVVGFGVTLVVGRLFAGIFTAPVQVLTLFVFPDCCGGVHCEFVFSQVFCGRICFGGRGL